LGQVLVSISPISVPRWVLDDDLAAAAGLHGAVVGELADHLERAEADHEGLRGVELLDEFFEISADGFQIDFTMVVTNIPTDDIRVMTGVPACIADVDDGSGSGTPDGGVTIDDLLWYLGKFEAGDAAADVDDGSSTGTTDNGVTIDDLLYYLARFAGGC
jgi:hypothetical protein